MSKFLEMLRGKFKQLVSLFDARDIFVLAGFVFLYLGVGEFFSYPFANIVIGVIILTKGLIKWA